MIFIDMYFIFYQLFDRKGIPVFNFNGTQVFHARNVRSKALGLAHDEDLRCVTTRAARLLKKKSNCCKFLTAQRWRTMWVNTCSWDVLPICSACMVFSSPECHFCLWANQSFFFNCFFLTIGLDFLDSTATLQALKATKRCPWCYPKG